MNYRIEGFHKKHGTQIEIAKGVPADQAESVKATLRNLKYGGDEHAIFGDVYINLSHFSAITFIQERP